MSYAESMLEKQLKALQISGYEREYRFVAIHVGFGAGIRQRLSRAKLKDWRFDFAWPEKMLAVEVEGGGWAQGRHTRGKGFHEDLIKYDAAMRLGWSVYQCSPDMVKSGHALKTIEALLSG